MQFHHRMRNRVILTTKAIRKKHSLPPPPAAVSKSSVKSLPWLLFNVSFNLPIAKRLKEIDCKMLQIASGNWRSAKTTHKRHKMFQSIEKALQPSHYENGTKCYTIFCFISIESIFAWAYTKDGCFWMWWIPVGFLIIWCAYYVSGANKSSALNKWNHVFVMGAIHQMLKSESGFSMIFSSLKLLYALFAVVCCRVPCSLFKMHHVKDPRIHSTGCIDKFSSKSFWLFFVFPFGASFSLELFSILSSASFVRML